MSVDGKAMNELDNWIEYHRIATLLYWRRILISLFAKGFPTKDTLITN